MGDKNTIYAISAIGVLLFLIVLVGSFYNITGAIIASPMRSPACVNPSENLHINSDTELCPGTFYLNDSDSNGTVIINASNVDIICYNTTIIGNMSADSKGIFSSGNENITILGCTLVNFTFGVYFDPSIAANVNVTVKSHLIYNVMNGIYLEDVASSFFYNNQIYNASSAGIVCLPACSANDIYENIIHDSSGHGINITDIGNFIRNNTIYNVGTGSDTYRAIIFTADGNLARDNNITDDGIAIINSNQTEIFNNRITNPEDDGVKLDTAWFTNITGNIIQGQNCFGVNLTASANNTIYNNVVNCSTGVNAEDDCAAPPCNDWNITKTSSTNIIGGAYIGGNFWSDYVGNDTDNDGIGDTNLPYNSTTIQTGGDQLPLYCLDADNDGYSLLFEEYCGPVDCNDTNPAVHPGAIEVCDNAIDDDCDGSIDCDDADCTGDPACAAPPPGPSGRPTKGVTLPPEEEAPLIYTLLKPGMSFNAETNTLTVVIPESQVLKGLKIKLKPGATLPPEVSVDAQVKSLDACADIADGKTLFSCMDASSNIPDPDIENVTLNYKVPNVLLVDRRINLDDLFASRDGQGLTVIETGSDASFTYFDVISPGLSMFVMAGISIPVPVIDLRPAQISLIILAIAAVLWILLLGWYFKHKPERPKKKLPPHIERLHKYIKHSKMLGATAEELKETLIKVGWAEEHIVEELKKFF